MKNHMFIQLLAEAIQVPPTYPGLWGTYPCFMLTSLREIPGKGEEEEGAGLVWIALRYSLVKQ